MSGIQNMQNTYFLEQDLKYKTLLIAEYIICQEKSEKIIRNYFLMYQKGEKINLLKDVVSLFYFYTNQLDIIPQIINYQML